MGYRSALSVFIVSKFDLGILSLEEQQKRHLARERKGKVLIQIILIKAPFPFRVTTSPIVFAYVWTSVSA